MIGFLHRLLLLLFLGTLGSASYSQTNKDKVKQLLEQATKARETYKEDQAIQLYKQVLALEASNLDALYNVGLLISRKGWLLEDTNEPLAIQYHKEALEWAKKTYKLYPNTFEGNVCMAAAIGRLAKYYDTKERVQSAWDIKKYADAAAKYNPSHPGLKHLLAWWNFELSKPTWLERSMANMLFGGLPKGADVKRAIQYMQELIKLNPNYTVYSYDLAKFYEYVGDKVKAIQCLKHVIGLKPVTPEDAPYIEAAKRFLKRLQ
ncbi:MAG: hypothetical protein SFW35_08205 [Chitinophagales bacterium]|nr:hypothetical protein [Chitinophagales bacterium]